MHEETCIRIFKTALFVIPKKNPLQITYMSVPRVMHKLSHSHRIACYSAVSMKGPDLHKSALLNFTTQ